MVDFVKITALVLLPSFVLSPIILLTPTRKPTTNKLDNKDAGNF